MQSVTDIALDGSSTSGFLWGCKELVQRAVAVRDDELGPSLRIVDVVAHAGRAEVWRVVVLRSCELPQSEAGKMTVVNWNLGLCTVVHMSKSYTSLGCY